MARYRTGNRIARMEAEQREADQQAEEISVTETITKAKNLGAPKNFPGVRNPF